jgi:hypothetical protein
MTDIRFSLTQSTINNGRIYFEASHRHLFPADAITESRGADDHAKATIVIEVDGVDFATDIRANGKRLSPRKSFTPWLKSQKAVADDQARLVKLAEGRFRLEYLGAGSAA